jgi:AraC-like DNA-binding protein
MNGATLLLGSNYLWRGAEKKEKGTLMSGKLQRITNWPERAHTVKYCVETLAQNCGVSVRTLERHIKLFYGKCPQDWLEDLLILRAMELLPDCDSIKAVAAELGYDHSQNFARDFKQHTGFTPSRFHKAAHLRA